jgi:hypothetical protein
MEANKMQPEAENLKTADQIWWEEFLGQPEDPTLIDPRPQYGPWYPEETE